MSITQNSRTINASSEVLYKAFTTADALETWLAPNEMTGKIHSFDLKVGGGYDMSLTYPADTESKGKTSEKEDRYKARFTELIPNRKITTAITFDSGDTAFSGEMIEEVTFEPEGSSTKVTITFTNIPKGIRPEDNEEGTRQSLEKLSKYVKSLK